MNEPVPLTRARTAQAHPANYWHVGAPDFKPRQSPLGACYDAVVIGAGYSGLGAAWGLARNGLSVLVLEQGAIGQGASSRNGGMVGPSFHELGMVGLTRKYGEEKTKAIMRAGTQALEYCQQLFASEQIDCDFQLSGRFRGARSKAHLAAMVDECKRLNRAVGFTYEAVAASDLASHTGSRAYVGGVLYPQDGGVHPKRLVNALAAKAEGAGAQLCDHVAACHIERTGNRFRIATPQASVTTPHLVIATNGYSDSRVKLMNDRIVPIDVSVAATAELGVERVRSLSPGLRMHGESGRVFIWSRPSPDHARFIFGGRLTTPGAPFEVQREQIAAAVKRIHPELEPGDFEHVWHGRIAYTVDHAPHLNQVGGAWLIGGYCGSGVTRSLFFADKLVGKILGKPGSDTPFDDVAFPKVPFRSLAPLGARVLTRYYGWLDKRDARGDGS